MEKKICEYTIECGGYNYVTLKWNEQFIICYDNHLMYAEEIIHEIEKRTRRNFREIPIKGFKEDFQGLRFFNGGWKRDFWDKFPSKKEIKSFMTLKGGVIY